MKKRKVVGDMTLKDLKKHCDTTNDCSNCRFLEICGIPFGAIPRKALSEETDDDN